MLRYVTADDVLERRATISQAEEDLKGLSFARCGISYLVNLKQIDQIIKDEAVIVLAIVIVFFVQYFPLLQKAFLI